MKKILFLVLYFGLTLICLNSELIATTNNNTRFESETKKEIINLQQKLAVPLSDNDLLKEKFYKHKLAVQQAKLIILMTSNFVYSYNHKKIPYKDVYEAVSTAFECGFIFPDIGSDHLDRFERIVRWTEDESAFNKNAVATWKKGQKITTYTINKHGKRRKHIIIIKCDSKDYGILQINITNLKYAKKIVESLYKSGIITFKVKQIKTTDDLFNIKTNYVVRCTLETDRKAMGWDYKHDYKSYGVDFDRKLKSTIKYLEKSNLYDKDLVSQYFYLIPIKTYNGHK